MKLLDTSVAIDHLRGLPEAVDLLSDLIEADKMLLASGSHTSRWSGNLTVDLPGRSDVRLTGGRLRASLFRARFKGSGPLE